MNSQNFVRAFLLYFDLFCNVSFWQKGENISNPIPFPQKIKYLHIHAKTSSSPLCSSSYKQSEALWAGDLQYSVWLLCCISAALLLTLMQSAAVGCDGKRPGSCDLLFLYIPGTCWAPLEGRSVTKAVRNVHFMANSSQNLLGFKQ